MLSGLRDALNGSEPQVDVQAMMPKAAEIFKARQAEANAEHLLADMKKFFSPQNSTAARNMNAARRSVDPAATAADFDQQLIERVAHAR